jgi:uncharacterized membrane protein YhiD involved in acid resistance
MDDFLSVYGSTRWLDAEQILLALVMPFVLAGVIATVYRWTFQSISYSRSFIHTMVLSSMIVSMVIMAVGDSFARGLGILGSLAIVRFRTPVRDPRDMVFLYACMGVGITCGAAAFGVAIISTVVISLAVLLLHWSPFASRRAHEALLRYVVPATFPSDDKVKDLLRTTCASFSLVALREVGQGERVECCYQIRLLDPSYQLDIVEGLSKIPDLTEPNLLLQRTTVEL